MSEFGEKKMVELAFNVANSAELSKDDRRLLDEMQASPDTQAEFDGYLRAVTEARAAFDELTIAPPETAGPIDDNTLAEYLDDVLTKDEREHVEARLAREPGALEQLLGLAELLQPDEAKDSAVAFVVELAKKGLRMLSHPAEGFELVQLRPAAVLGPEKNAPVQVWTQDLGPIRVQCTLQRVKEDLLGLTIKLIAPDPPPRGTRISLKSEGKLIQSDVVKEGGEVILRDLEAKTYELEIAIPATNVASMRFDFVSHDSE